MGRELLYGSRCNSNLCISLVYNWGGYLHPEYHKREHEISVNILREFWDRNLLNFFATPLKSAEWMGGVMLLSLCRIVVSFLFGSTLQLFGPACLVYLLSDVRPTVELGDSLNQEGVFNPFLV